MHKIIYMLLSVQKYDYNHIRLYRHRIFLEKHSKETGNHSGLSEGKLEVKGWRRG